MKKRRPARRRKLLKPTALDRYKNYVRGNKNKLTALTDVRRIMPNELLPSLASWSMRALKYDIYRSIEPRKLTDLQAHRVATPGTLERELAWCEALLASRISSIKRFIEWKLQLEDNLINGNAEESLKIIEQIEHYYGPSLWAISIRIAVLQIFEGIEAQKEYIAHVKSFGHALTSFLTYWWGVRIEEDTTLERYSQRLGKLIERTGVGAEQGAYFGYLLLGVLPPAGSEQLLLSVSTTSTTIDLYQLYSDLLVVCVAEGRPAAAPLVETALKLGLCDVDPKIHKVLIIFGQDTPTDPLKSASLTFRNIKYSDQQETTTRDPSLSPLGLEEVAAASLTKQYTAPPNNRLAIAISSSISQLDDRTAVGVRSANDLLKLGSALDKLNLGLWCLASALEAQQPNALISTDFEKLRLVNTPYLEPFLASYLDAANRDRFIDAIQKRYGTQVTALAALVASGAISKGNAHSGGVSDLFLSRNALVNAFKSENYEESLRIAANLNRSAQQATKLSIQAQIFSLIHLTRLEEALVACAAWYLEDRTMAAWLPLEELSDAIRNSNKTFDGMIEKPILYDALARTKGGEYNSLKAYATEDFVLSYGVERPSQLNPETIKTSRSQLIYFYHEICSQQTLQLSVAYQSERELEDELIAICGTLTKLDPDNLETYEEQARELVRARSIKDALKELQRSKVSIDEDALRLKFKESFKEDFDRYIKLLKSGVAVVDEEYRRHLLKAVSSGEIPASLFDVPDNEASALFAALVVNVISELTYNAEHGLDCYLSLRIRHGTLSGQLRGPLEREHIVTRRDASTREYQPNEYWRSRLAEHVHSDDLNQILRWLADFSRDYDNLILDLTDQRIQVLRKDKPNGLFQLGVTELTIYGLATEVKPITTFDEFLTACIDTFWGLVDVSLERIRGYIDQQLRSSIRDQFDRLDAALREIYAPQISALSDAIRRARTDTGLRLDSMRDWFVQPTPNSSVPFSLRELVDIALTTIKSFRPEFNPHVSIEADDIPTLTGALRLFSDIFFILFENISLYSGNPVNPHIKIYSGFRAGKMMVRVTNDIERTVSVERIRKQIRLARQRIDSGAYLSAVRSEGGTGLPKLAKLIKGTQERPPLEFGLNEDGTNFFVEFELDVITTENLALEDAT